MDLFYYNTLHLHPVYFITCSGKQVFQSPHTEIEAIKYFSILQIDLSYAMIKNYTYTVITIK